MHSLDLRGLKCPLPILKTRRAMQSLETGQTLEVVATDEGILRDMPDYCRHSGAVILEENHQENEYCFILQKN